MLQITIAALACSMLNNLLAADSSVTPNKPACCVKESVGTGAISDRSLYQLESTWTNDAGTAGLLPSRAQVQTTRWIGATLMPTNEMTGLVSW